MTTPARTLVDLAAGLRFRQLRRTVREAQAQRRVNIPHLAEALGRLGARRGLRNLARIVATGPAPTRSELEDVVLELMLAAGLAHPDVNAALRVDGRRVVPDFRWSEQHPVVEADGAAWHEHRLAREDHAERQALLEAHGERVLRVTWHQAIAEPARTVARILAAGAPLATPEGRILTPKPGPNRRVSRKVAHRNSTLAAGWAGRGGRGARRLAGGR